MRKCPYSCDPSRSERSSAPEAMNAEDSLIAGYLISGAEYEASLETRKQPLLLS